MESDLRTPQRLDGFPRARRRRRDRAPRRRGRGPRERDVVLGEKDLAVVAHAVTAGRHSGGNIVTHLRVTLSSNVGNAVVMLAAVRLLLPLSSLGPPLGLLGLPGRTARLWRPC